MTADDADASGRDAEMLMDREFGMEEPSSVAMGNGRAFERGDGRRESVLRGAKGGDK